MATKTLTAKVRFDTKSAEASLNRLAKKINNVQNAINKTSKNNTRLTREINKATSATNKLNTATNRVATTTNKVVNTNNKAVNSAKKLSGAYNSANRSASTLVTTVKRLAATYLGVMGMKAIVNTSDTITSTQNKLNTLNGGDKNLTQEQMDKMYVSSNKVRMNYSDMLANASKSMTLAGDAFQGNMDNAIRFQEIMAETYALGGASAPEMSNSMYQLIQALGSDTLQGDELRAVREGAPLAYQAIEKFAQGVYNTNDSLKDLASQGKITSDIVVAAIMDASTELDAKFAETAWTFGAVWNRIKSTAVKAFEPISNQLSEMLNRVAESGIFEKMEILFLNLSKVIQIAFQIIYNVVEAISTAISWVAENWNWLSRVILTALTAIGVTMAVVLFPQFVAWLQNLALTLAYYWLVGIEAVASAVKAAAAWAVANWQMLLIIVVIVAVITALIWLADSFEDACGMIVGVITAAASIVWNTFITLITAIVQNAILPLATAWDTFANFFGNLFNDPISAIIKSFGKLADSVLSILQTIARGIDAVFGSNLSSAVSGWKNSLSSKTDALVDKYGNGTYEEKSDITSQINDILSSAQGALLWQTSDAYTTGYTWGSSAGSWIADKISGLSDGLSLDSIGKQLGLTFDSSLPSGDGYGVGGNYSPGNLLGGIADDTGAIKDSLDITNEDLKYLRDIAEQEVVNRFTTAEIHVEMGGINNVVNENADLDGIIDYMVTGVQEAMERVAEGVHD